MPRVETLIQEPSGKIAGVDPRRLYDLPFALLTNPPNNFVAVPANSSSPLTAITVSGEGPCEIANLAHEKLGECRVSMQIQDGETQRGLMNRACHIDTIFGSGQQPYWLPESLYIDELRSLIINFTDLSGVANQVAVNMGAARYLALQVDPYMEGIRKRLEERQYMATPYFYTFDPGVAVIPAGGTLTSTITVGQRDHFQLHTLTVVATSMAFDIQIIDVARGESLIDAPNNTTRQVAAGVILGSANFPYKFHTPRLINIGQKLDVIMTDRSGAQNTVYLTLGGRGITDKMWR